MSSLLGCRLCFFNGGEGLTYQQNARDRPSSGRRGGWGERHHCHLVCFHWRKSAYSRKNTSADSSACASLTCESRAYSLILWQKSSPQRETLVCLAAFQHSALHQPRSFCHSVTAACLPADGLQGSGAALLCPFLMDKFQHIASLNIRPLLFLLRQRQSEVHSLEKQDSNNISTTFFFFFRRQRVERNSFVKRRLMRGRA